ncbi:armadillo repeat-containing protein 10-like [Bufo gargarizans]|uniref:armadillo repeat-containing protein 10-like n=1 Tax=Bufo gargarizans TaxID=30331 RepID=UPI001CF37087|nr:armadillo repeat-containing protein 10-like [Bufo gargarizans]
MVLHRNEQEYEAVNDALLKAKEKLRTRLTENQIQVFERKLNRKLVITQTEIKENKKDTYLWDKNDYETGRAFDWGRRRQRRRHPQRRNRTDVWTTDSDSSASDDPNTSTEKGFCFCEESRSEAIPKLASNLERHDLETLLQILSSNLDTSAQEQILITLCNISAFSVNHDIIRNLDGICIIGGFLSHADPKIKAGALNVLNNLSLNLPNQEQIQAFINEVLKDITECSLNSEVQLAGLRLVINMSVTNKYHEKMEDSIQNLLNLLDEGNDTTKIHTLKLLVNMSANPLMTRPLLASKAPSLFPSLFDGSINRDVLIRALSFTANLSENLAKEQQYDGPRHLKEDSTYAVLFKDPAVLQRNLVPLLLFPDMEIKEEAYRCIRSTKHY